MPNEKPEVDLNDLSDKGILLRIAQELKSIRVLLTGAVHFQREAEKEIPEYMRRFMDYMHDVSDITYMYESRGHQAPEYVKREAERCDDRLRQLLNILHTDGGEFEKIRREMAKDPTNRWDHTRQLSPPKEQA
jgi:23S rRNA pseudoU1915 N3-methylase RlmH